VDEHVYAQRYRLVEALPPGRAEAAHRALDASGNPVVITVLRPADPEAFARRMGAVAAARHLDLAAILDLGRDGPDTFVVSEDVRGEDAAVLVARGPLPVGEATMIGAEAAAGLVALHGQGAVHGGLDPSVVVQAGDGTVKVTGAGLAAALPAPDLRPGDPAAGARYLSPEEVSGRPSEPASDVYRLGLVLYLLLTGSHAFDGADAAAVAQEQLDGVVQPPQFLNPEVPPAVAQIVLRTLEKDPARRGSAARLRQELAAVLGSAHVVAAPQKPRGRAWIWVVGILVAAAFAGLAVALATGLFKSNASPQIKVPDVVGSTVASATATITQAKLVVGTVTDVQSTLGPAGTVVTQSPAAGRTVAESSSVDLEVAATAAPTPASLPVPAVVGLSQTAAQSALSGAGFVVVVTQEPSSSVAGGSVISQSPSAGVVVARGSTVSIVVSTGTPTPTASPSASP
jgi:eukaryotic-like serine/threonine-protein kinase